MGMQYMSFIYDLYNKIDKIQEDRAMDTRYIEKMSNSLQAMIKVTDELNARLTNLEVTLRGIETVVNHYNMKIDRCEALMYEVLRKEGMGIESDEQILNETGQSFVSEDD